MEAEALLARSLGLRGKACIHPRQVPVANRVFRPSEAEVSWARQVLVAYDDAARDGRGALVVQGALDRPRPRPAGAHDLGNHGRGGHVTTDTRSAPKEWRGRFFEDIEVGDVYRSRLGRTITETDNIWFTLLTLNTNQMHFNTPYAERTRSGSPSSTARFTLALVTGHDACRTRARTRRRTSRWTDITLPNPVFVGDTLWAESEILETRESTLDADRRDRLDALPRDQPAPRGRDRVQADVHGLQAGRARGRERSFPGTETAWNV